MKNKKYTLLTLLKRAGTEIMAVGLAMARHSRIISLVGTIARAPPIKEKESGKNKKKSVKIDRKY